VIFVATKKGWTTNIFSHPSLLLLFLDPGSGIRDGRKSGSGINIPDPQHCFAVPGSAPPLTRLPRPQRTALLRSLPPLQIRPTP
jgi:hypothetical protein